MFLRVTLPLSMPGVVAGVLLTFIPAAGDFINAQLLGTPKQFMIGNVIQSRYLVLADYPTAAALSFLLMAFSLIIVIVWARIAGTEALLGSEERAGMTAAIRKRRPADWLLNCTRACADLPAAPHRGHHRLLLQQPGRPLQLHLAGVQPRRLEAPLRRARRRRRTKNSLEIAAFSTLIATALGTLTALALVRYEFRFAGR